MKVHADTSVCVASGQCALLAPETFDQREDNGIVILRDDEPPRERQDAARQAVLTCPSGALSLSEP